MLKRLQDADVSGKRVLVRVDFNVPLDKAGRILDDTRMEAVLPTIRHLTGRGARTILISHLGRPKGRCAEASLGVVARHLEHLLKQPVAFADDCVGEQAERAVQALEPGGVLLLENVRFHEAEERNDAEFAARLAGLADLFVSDAFGVAHRAHASNVGVAKHLPAYAGLLIEREHEALSRLIEPEKPFVAVIGGAKISDKLPLLERLLDRVDRLLVGGGMANTLLLAMGCKMGKSLVEPDCVEAAESLIARAEEQGKDLLLPVDLVVGEAFREDAEHQVVSSREIPAGWIAMDIGPATVERFAQGLEGARTLFWNGPMGVAEWPNFREGTRRMAAAVAASPGFKVVGGGDSVAALAELEMLDRMDHVSTGGGASLQFIEGKTLPGIECLSGR